MERVITSIQKTSRSHYFLFSLQSLLSQLLSVHCVALGISFNQVPSGASDIFPRKAFQTLNEQSFQYNPCAQQLSTEKPSL